MPKRDRVTKRMKDKWRAKTWYTVHAPEMFNRAILGETPAEDVSKLRERVAEVTVQDLTGDFSKMHIKVKFKITDAKDGKASTVFVGHDTTADYIRRLTRRKRSRIDGVFDLKTKDGAIIRVKPMAITDRRIQASKQSAIRKVMHRVVYEKAIRMTLDEFVKAMILGDMAKEVALACKSIQPIFRVEIRKSELLKMPEATEELAEASEEAPEEAEVEETAPAS